MVDNDIELGPQFKLALPVGNGREGCDDEEGATDPVLVDRVDPGQRLRSKVQIKASTRIYQYKIMVNN